MDCYWARLSGTSDSIDDITIKSISAAVVKIGLSDTALACAAGHGGPIAPWFVVLISV